MRDEKGDGDAVSEFKRQRIAIGRQNDVFRPQDHAQNAERRKYRKAEIEPDAGGGQQCQAEHQIEEHFIIERPTLPDLWPHEVITFIDIRDKQDGPDVVPEVGGKRLGIGGEINRHQIRHRGQQKIYRRDSYDSSQIKVAQRDIVASCCVIHHEFANHEEKIDPPLPAVNGISPASFLRRDVDA